MGRPIPHCSLLLSSSNPVRNYQWFTFLHDTHTDRVLICRPVCICMCIYIYMYVRVYIYIYIYLNSLLRARKFVLQFKEKYFAFSACTSNGATVESWVPPTPPPRRSIPIARCSIVDSISELWFLKPTTCFCITFPLLSFAPVVRSVTDGQTLLLYKYKVLSCRTDPDCS